MDRNNFPNIPLQPCDYFLSCVMENKIKTTFSHFISYDKLLKILQSHFRLTTKTFSWLFALYNILYHQKQLNGECITIQ